MRDNSDSNGKEQAGKLKKSYSHSTRSTLREGGNSPCPPVQAEQEQRDASFAQRDSITISLEHCCSKHKNEHNRLCLHDADSNGNSKQFNPIEGCSSLSQRPRSFRSRQF